MELVLLNTYNSLIETYNIPGTVIFILAISIPLVLLLLFYLMMVEIQELPPYEGAYDKY